VEGIITVMKMPVLFVGHGSPENAIDVNEYTVNWKKLAEIIPRPTAILCVSAHWTRKDTAVTAMENPKTIHDFYGFSEELYRIKYDVKGSPEHAKKIIKLIKSVKVDKDYEWGLDHGTWSVLIHMYPKADIPVLQLSLNYNASLKTQYQIGRELKPLRDDGVFIIGSGNLVHNLIKIDPLGKPYDWAIDFDKFMKKNLEARADEALINYTSEKISSLAHPTNEHYLPLMYALGATENESPQFFNESIFAASISMRCALFGLGLIG
jgi:4,5-DOPA dioxygenase extradiol